MASYSFPRESGGELGAWGWRAGRLGRDRDYGPDLQPDLLAAFWSSGSQPLQHLKITWEIFFPKH